MPGTSVYDVIRSAISAKATVRATYRGRLRLMCPHVLGVKGSRLHCLFYQFGGSSRSGLGVKGSWRCIAIDELADISVEEGEWHTAVDYDLNSQTCVDQVDFAVEL
jgi:hypothetical protein